MASKVTFVEIDNDREGQRIDNFLMAHLKGVPRSMVYRIVRKGEVRVNKGRVKPEYKLTAGDVVRIPPVKLPESQPQPKPSHNLVRLLDSSVLYEDESLMIVNKPSGLAVHGGSGIQLGLIESLRNMRPDARSLELVHRLDRDTSGCVMIAKKRSVLRYLHAQLREGHINKQYLCLVAGKWPERKTQVNAPLLKNQLSSGERMVRVDPDGKKSLTYFSVEQYYQGVTLLKASPYTGRTHQIRVHAQHAGHGLVGDPKYGDDDTNKKMKSLGFNRLFLHACSLELVLPDGKALKVEAPLEASLEEALTQLTPQEPFGS